MDDARARQASADGKVNRVQLKELLLDDTNPRFGLQDRGAGQEQILDLIVEKFGVNDVLSSLAVNVQQDTANELLPDVKAVRKLAADLEKRLQEAARGGEDEDTE